MSAIEVKTVSCIVVDADTVRYGGSEFRRVRTCEQATAAMPGGGECEWVLEHSGTLYDKWRCSECGYLHVESRVDGGATDLDPNYCPNCGKAVRR